MTPAYVIKKWVFRIFIFLFGVNLMIWHYRWLGTIDVGSRTVSFVCDSYI